jgi:anti-sigma factor RsiW
MSDDELRTALQKLAEPVSGTARPATRDEVIAEVDRRRRRRWVGGGAAAACVAAIAVGASIVAGGPTG